MLRRPTAIKLLPPGKTSAEQIRRFEREVQLTSELTDPHTMAIFDYGRSPDGTFYYAMEYLDGIDLERLVRRRGPMPPGRAVKVLRQVCDALEEAHDRGLVHRDIKPANLILCERGKRADVVKVVDFGLVKAIGRDEGGAPTGVAGSPSYLSPEAIRDPQNVQPASDLYALGMVGYFLLTGRTLFTGKTFLETCGHHLNTPPSPASSFADQPIAVGLDDLLLRCVQKDPRRRPSSAAQLRAALDALDDVEPWTDADAEAWWRDFRGDPSSLRPVKGAGADPDALTVIVDLHGR
jgi:serine/threonine-protein kinase